MESTRLDLDIRKRQERLREQLAHSIRAINNMSRTLRKSGEGSGTDGDNAENLLYLEPLDQRALRAEIAVAKVQRAIQYDACRRMRRRGAVFRARRERLEGTLSHRTQEVRDTVAALERVMGQLRKQLALARIQERVFRQELVKVERKGLDARRNLAAVEEQLVLLERHPHKVCVRLCWCYAQHNSDSAVAVHVQEYKHTVEPETTCYNSVSCKQTVT